MKTALLLAVLVIAACGSEDPPPPSKPAEGRAETQSIRNTQAIGYDGKAIADKVDATLDANDRRVHDIRTEADADAPPAD